MSANALSLPASDRRASLDAAAPLDVRISLLDGFELRCAGESVPLPMAAQRVVSFLALHTRPLHRAFIAGTLWFSGSECDAQACLRSALWRVRRACPVTVVIASRTHVQLAPNVAVDVRDQVVIARRALDCTVEFEDIATHQLEGELLPDWYDDWLSIERERLRELRLHALEALAVRFAESGQYAEAIEAAFAALRGDHLRESAYRTLVRVYLTEGNRSEAIRVLARYRELLRRKLGIDPPPDLDELVRDDPVVTLP